MGGESKTPQGPPSPDLTGMMGDGGDEMAMMMKMMEGMAAMAAAPAPMPQMPAIPEVFAPPDIDWTEKQAQLAKKMSAEFHVDQLQKKGRLGTVHTSPLLDSEEAETTQSILVGE